MNIIELKYRNQTAWYRSDKVTSISKAAELLNRVIDSKADPDIATVEKLGGDDLHPLTSEEYMAALRELADGSERGLVAEIDLANDSGCFTYIGTAKSSVISIYTAISRLAGLYQMSIIKKTGKLDSWGLTERIIDHCDWVTYKSPQERFGTQAQEQPAGQDMTMQ